MIKPIPVTERNTLDLLELVCQLHARSLMYKTKEMHDASVEARQELERRIVEFEQPKCSVFMASPSTNFSKCGRSRFNKGDIVICLLKGGGYGDKFTVLEDNGGLNLLSHTSGASVIVDNREDYELA